LPTGTIVDAYQAQNHVHALGMEFGLVFKRGIHVEKHDLLGEFDTLMFMTIDLGFSGQPFCEDQLVEIQKAREWCPGSIIAADGHVDGETARKIVAAGANRLISTSYLSGEHALERYSQLKGL
jgi:pentose-5-phosphate-3-epimerase